MPIDAPSFEVVLLAGVAAMKRRSGYLRAVTTARIATAIETRSTSKGSERVHDDRCDGFSQGKIQGMGRSVLITIVVLASVAVGTLAFHAVVFFIFRHLFGAFGEPGQLLAQVFAKNLKHPTRIVLPLAGLTIATPLVHVRSPFDSALLHALAVALILSLGFLVIRVSYVLDDLLANRFRTDRADNFRARQVHTQIQVLRRVLVVVVSVVTVSIALLTFPAVRAAGAGLLASAGVIGLVAGIAARPIATNVLAGIQIAVSQPIRVDDVVVVQGYWGRVEQIALTYVVIRVWDMRRLVLPISYFIENSFENWTRRTADILGWVFFEVDYSAPIDEIRSEFEKVLGLSSNWDGHVGRLQVTNCGTSTVQLRALMSAKDSNTSWELQCEVREKLIGYLQREHPGSLPRQRVQLMDDRSSGLDRSVDLIGESTSPWR